MTAMAERIHHPILLLPASNDQDLLAQSPLVQRIGVGSAAAVAAAEDSSHHPATTMAKVVEFPTNNLGELYHQRHHPHNDPAHTRSNALVFPTLS